VISDAVGKIDGLGQFQANHARASVVEAGVMSGYYWVMLCNPLQLTSVLHAASHYRVGIYRTPVRSGLVLQSLLGKENASSAGLDLLAIRNSCRCGPE
jgi:hypothetical protein